MAKKKLQFLSAEGLADKAIGLHDLPPPMLAWALDYLKYYGWLPERADAGATQKAAKGFQAAAGIDADGVIGPQTLETMWLPRCGCRDDAFTHAVRWRKREIKWWVEKYIEGVPGLSRADQDDIHVETFCQYEAVIDVAASRAANKAQADLVIGVAEGRQAGFDGPGGVLAWCEIPPGDDRPLRLMFDRAEAWIRSADVGTRGILFPLVGLHEMGHFWGMLHVSGELAVLNAIYNPNLKALTKADVKTLFALGYAPAKNSPEPPPQPPVTPPTTPVPGGRSRLLAEFEGGKIVGLLADGWDTRRK
jgi:hypothetical protein